MGGRCVWVVLGKVSLTKEVFILPICGKGSRHFIACAVPLGPYGKINLPTRYSPRNDTTAEGPISNGSFTVGEPDLGDLPELCPSFGSHTHRKNTCFQQAGLCDGSIGPSWYPLRHPARSTQHPSNRLRRFAADWNRAPRLKTLSDSYDWAIQNGGLVNPNAYSLRDYYKGVGSLRKRAGSWELPWNSPGWPQAPCQKDGRCPRPLLSTSVKFGQRAHHPNARDQCLFWLGCLF